jgi:Eukaryotic aspartyl protease
MLIGRVHYSTYFAVQGFWHVNIAIIRGNCKILLSDVAAVIDTGSNYIVGDLSRVYYLHTNLGGKKCRRGFYSCEYHSSSNLMFHFHRPPAVPCNNFPTIRFAFGGPSGRRFRIPASLLNLGPVSNGSPDCISGIVSGDDLPIYRSEMVTFIKYTGVISPPFIVWTDDRHPFWLSC